MEIFKIVLEGPPHSGKSSVLKRLKQRAAERKIIPIAFSEEIATEILREDPNFPLRDKYAFQKEVFMRQTASEERLTKTLSKLAPHTPFAIEIFDRGAADLYVYLDEENATEICKTDLSTLLGRYTLVIHLAHYQTSHLKAGNQSRMETDRSEILALAQRSEAVWGKHPHFITVPPMRTIDEKTKAVINIINRFFDTEIF